MNQTMNHTPTLEEVQRLERQVLAEILHGDWVMYGVLERACLEAKDFSTPAHREIFGALAALCKSGRPIHGEILAVLLETEGRLEKAGGLAYLNELIREWPKEPVMEKVVERAAELSSCAMKRRDTRELLARLEEEKAHMAEEQTRLDPSSSSASEPNRATRNGSCPAPAESSNGQHQPAQEERPLKFHKAVAKSIARQQLFRPVGWVGKALAYMEDKGDFWLLTPGSKDPQPAPFPALHECLGPWEVVNLEAVWEEAGISEPQETVSGAR